MDYGTADASEVSVANGACRTARIFTNKIFRGFHFHIHFHKDFFCAKLHEWSNY